MHYSSFPGRINVEKTSEQYFQLLPLIENQKSCSIGQILEYKVDDKQVDDENGSEETI